MSTAAIQPALMPVPLSPNARADMVLAEVLAAFRLFPDAERAARLARILDFLGDPRTGPADILQRRALLTFWRCVRDLLGLEADGQDGQEVAEALERRAIAHLSSTRFDQPSDLMPLPPWKRVLN